MQQLRLLSLWQALLQMLSPHLLLLQQLLWWL
jgi:hypothetical protein